MRLSCSPWLLPQALLLLLSTDLVFAFFPYNPANTNTKNNGMLRPDSSGTVDLKKRFYSYSPSTIIGKGSPQRDVKGSVKLDIIKVPGKARRQNSFNVFHADPTTVPHSLPISSDGFDYSYFSVIHFGSKRQPMWMLIDTGASNTWLISSNCTLEPCKMHNTFGSEDSDSLSMTDIPFTVTYGSGNVSGFLVNDSMSFAGFELPRVGFGSVTNMSEEFKSYPMDGILGLGRAPAYKVKVPTVMQELQKSGLLEKNIIGVNLQRHSDGAKDGQIVFGDIDKTKYTGDLSYTTTLPNVDHWEVPLDDMLVDGTPLNFKRKAGIFDTGTSFILMPFDDAKRIHDAIPGSSESAEWDANWELPCSTTAKIELVVSSAKYRISPKDYIGEPVKDGKCRSRIVGHQPFEENEWLLGAAFLKNVYAVFDFDENRIGLAMRKETEGSSSPTSQPAPTSSGSPPVSPVGPPGEIKTGAATPTQSNKPHGSSNGVKTVSISSIVPLLCFSLGSAFSLSSTLSPW
ncbi:hypothetical protein AJ78_08196 [Emergomyces pasteurianus Ep9510]|uniref:Probable aspartic-type endopeptidase CTSD n=1 Tax=Emergomyces pasteurianus Ep9510 TaxID=1447872 RepID=A0A1J9PST7_9EURO|nr:hypothetical protein AJ78_08196 [Emergomyces pasteurianus Ep9510]